MFPNPRFHCKLAICAVAVCMIMRDVRKFVFSLKTLCQLAYSDSWKHKQLYSGITTSYFETQSHQSQHSYFEASVILTNGGQSIASSAFVQKSLWLDGDPPRSAVHERFMRHYGILSTLLSTRYYLLFSKKPSMNSKFTMLHCEFPAG